MRSVVDNCKTNQKFCIDCGNLMGVTGKVHVSTSGRQRIKMEYKCGNCGRKMRQ